MSTENTVTDQFNLVQREEAKGILRLFSRQRSVSDGFCLVVFRKEEYRGSILSDDVITEGDLKRRSERLGVRDSDTILRINLGPRPLSMSEKLGTQDGYTRPYTLDLEISVNDPRSFAQRFLQGSDPVKLARIAIEGYLQRYALRKRHDELREDMLRDYAEQALGESSNRSFGLQVIAAHKITLYMDPLRRKELDIQQQAHLKEKEIREGSRIKQIETQEDIDIRKAATRRDAEVKRLETEYEQEHASLTARFERTEDEKRKQYEMYMEAYLLEEKIKQRAVTRVDEVREKEHEIGLEGRQKEFLRLEEGKDLNAKREQEARENEHLAQRELFKLQEGSKQRDLTRVYEIKEQKHKDIYEIEEQARKLALETTSSAHTRRETLLNTVGVNSINALSERISRMIEDGRPLDEVFNEHPELKDIFQIPGISGHKSVQQEPFRIEETNNPGRSTSGNLENNPIASAHTPSQPVSGEQVAENQNPVQETGTLPGILRQQNDTINITDLGMTLVQTELSASQQDIASTHTTTAFIISALAEHGPAQDAQLTTGDIVVEINGEELRDIQSISRILTSYKSGSAVSLCILRGEELKMVDV